MINLLPFILPIVAETAGSESIVSALIVPLIIIFVLVILNGFFVAAEFAVIGARPSKMEQLVEEGNSPRAAKVLDTLTDPVKQDRYIAAAQLGITVVTIALGMYGEPAIAHYIEPYLQDWFNIESIETVHSVGYWVAIALMTFLHVVVGEMVPKAVALAAPNDYVMRLQPSMSIVQKILFPFVVVLNSIGRLLLRIFRVPAVSGKDRLFTQEEIEQLVTESTDEGLIGIGTQSMIANIFDFSERSVEQVMTPRPKIEAISYDMPKAQLTEFVLNSNHSRFPVYEGDLDHIVGVVHLKDLIKHQLENPNAPDDLRPIVREVDRVTADKKIEELLENFRANKMHMAIVLDEHAGVDGVVTLEDLVEEVVGEVRDEFDNEKEPFVEIHAGEIEVSGDYLLADLKDHIYLGEDDDLPNVETVGGIVVDELRRPPEVGDIVTIGNNVKFEVLSVEGRAIQRLRVNFPAVEEEPKSADNHH